MNEDEIKAEIQKIRDDRADKGGRMSNQEKEAIASLEAMLPTSEEPQEPEMTEEAPEEAPQGMKRIMIMNHNAGMPGGKAGGAVKVWQFDVVETTAEHAEALCNAKNSKGQPMARETQDPVNVEIIDGERVRV